MIEIDLDLALKYANIYDALRLFISQGRVNSEVSRLYDLLKDLEEFEANLNTLDKEYNVVGDQIALSDCNLIGENTAIKDYNLFEFVGIDLKKIRGAKMTRSKLIDRLNNHNYLNLLDYE